MIGNKKNVLLLTATITPKPEQPGLLVSDQNVRLTEYKKALNFYVQLLQHSVIDGIIFAENSGRDLAELQQEFPSADIEWLSYYDLDYPKECHRGYGEFRLIDFVFRDSKTIKNLSTTDAIWKISGRYILRNMKTMIHKTPLRFDLYCHLVNKWAELSVIAWSPRGYSSYIKDKWQLFASEMAPELILAKEFKSSAEDELKKILVYQWPPYLEGRRGTDGSSYQGKFFALKHAIKAGMTLMGRRL